MGAGLSHSCRQHRSWPDRARFSGKIPEPLHGGEDDFPPKLRRAAHQASPRPCTGSRRLFELPDRRGFKTTSNGHDRTSPATMDEAGTGCNLASLSALSRPILQVSPLYILFGTKIDTDMNTPSTALEACDIIRDSFDKFEREIKEICGISDSVDEWLDTKHLCELLGVSIRTINYYRVRMLIPYTRFGNKCYYKVADVIEVLNEKGGI